MHLSQILLLKVGPSGKVTVWSNELNSSFLPSTYKHLLEQIKGRKYSEIAKSFQRDYMRQNRDNQFINLIHFVAGRNIIQTIPYKKPLNRNNFNKINTIRPNRVSNTQPTTDKAYFTTTIKSTAKMFTDIEVYFAREFVNFVD